MEREWEREPNHVEFDYRGFFCEITRHDQMKHLCGYVYIPLFQGPMTQRLMAYLLDHPLDNGFDYMVFEEYFDIYVHGGVTYGDIVEKEIGAFIKIGFDCAHSGDLIPGMKATLEQVSRAAGRTPSIWGDLGLFRDTYRNMAYVKKEIENMVDAIIGGEDLYDEE